jgi:preprotein translocase subunit SecF
MKGLHFIPENTTINFIGVRYVAFVLSLVLVVGSIALIAMQGLNFGVDFTGGTVIEIRTQDLPDLAKMRTDLNVLGLGPISLQEFGEPKDLLIRLPQQDGGPEAQKAAIEAVQTDLKTQLGEEGYDLRRTEFVGPQVGKELKQQGINAVIYAMLGIFAYIWLRFEWQFSLAAVAALLHDTIAVVGFFALTQMEFNLSTVAAILMVAGYSINDTVVVFDRVREDLRRYKKKPLPDLFNMSINHMLDRTVMTSLTTLIALVALYVYGGEVLRGFISALIVGIVVGTYSSTYIATSLLLFADLRKGKVAREASEQPAEG